MDCRQKPSVLTYDYSRYVDGIVTVTEEKLPMPFSRCTERAKLIVEGRGAPLASSMGSYPIGKRIVVLLSGGNIDVNILQIIERGLVQAGTVLDQHNWKISRANSINSVIMN